MAYYTRLSIEMAPNLDPLAEVFLKVEERSAIATVSPSGLSLDAPKLRIR